MSGGVNGGFNHRKEHFGYWRVLDRRCNFSAFNGYHRTPSDYSSVVCLMCCANRSGGTAKTALWRTKAGYVRELPDAAAGEYENALHGRLPGDEPPPRLNTKAARSLADRRERRRRLPRSATRPERDHWPEQHAMESQAARSR
jgi:hypothetical protein